MPERAALITGGSSGIGLATARALAAEGYGVTISARRPDKLEAAAAELRSEGFDEIHAVAANVADADGISQVVESHREQFGRLDVLMNNAGVGIGQPLDQLETSKVDMQIAVNLRAVILGTREAIGDLRAAGAEHGKALIINTASIAGVRGQGWISVYSAAKGGVIAFSEATQSEVRGQGIQVTALCPGFVDTPIAEWAKGSVPGEDMIRPEDIAEAVLMLLRTSPNCLIGQLIFERPGEDAGAGISA